MPNCPNCGNEVPAGSRFCSNCGAPQGQMPPAYYPPPAKKEGRPRGLVLLVVAVVVVVILVGVGVLFVFYEQSSGNVGMSVSGLSPYTANHTSSAPADGREWVVVNITMYNNRSYSIPETWGFFNLDTSGQDGCSPVYALESYYPAPSMISPGQSISFSIVFDIPQGSDPTELRFSGLIAESSCPVP